MTTNYLREYGPSLIENGYSIVPIKRGTKAPVGVAGWQNINATLNDLGKWASQGYEGVGILAKYNPGVDIDVLDTEVSRLMVSYVRRRLPGGLIRIGKAPKTLIVYRTTSPFKKIRSATYEDRFGDLHAVEILGDGQQFLCYAEHCDTLRPYEWRKVDDGNNLESCNGPGIDTVESANLPLLTAEDARSIVSHFETVAGERTESHGWKKVREGTSSLNSDVTFEGESGPSDFTTMRPPLSLTTPQIQRDLDAVCPDEYETWTQVGMCLWHQFNGSLEGFALWDTWSAMSANYNGQTELMSKWTSFKPDPGQTPLTFATVRKWANDARMEEDPLTEFLDRYVYVAEGDFVHDLYGSPHDKPFEMKEFRNFTSNIRMEIEVPAPLANDPDRTSTKVVPVSAQWMVSSDRKHANSFVYVPGGRRTLKGADGRQYVNRFHMPIFADPCDSAGANSACEEELLGIFHRHMEFIIPVEVERDWFISWMAYNVQRPGMRCKVTPLLIATDHGTGRGWIVQLMNLLLGSWNCTKTKMSTLNGDNSAGQYQDFMNESLLCAVEEVKDADKPYGVLDSIRSYLTEDTLEINLKYGAKETKKVYANFFWNSNHADALVLKAEDRRINVFKTVDPPKGADYYERLYGWLEPIKGSDENFTGNPKTVGPVSLPSGGMSSTGDVGADSKMGEESVEEETELYDKNGLNVGAGVACLSHFLMRRDLSGFRDNRPIDNAARRQLIENCQTDIEGLFLEMVENPPMNLMTSGEIHTFLEAEKDSYLDGESGNGGFYAGLSDSEKRQIKKLCQHHMVSYDQIKVTFKYVESGTDVNLSGLERVKREKPWKVRCWGFDEKVEYSAEDIRKVYEKR